MSFLYHYTSYEVFQNIIEYNTLRVSEHNFLNDNEEISCFFKLIERVIERNSGCMCEASCENLFCNDEKHKMEKSEVKKAVEIFKVMILDNDIFNYYILSLTTEKDKSVLWSNFVQNDVISFSIDKEKVKEYISQKNMMGEVKKDKWNLPYYNLHEIKYLDFDNVDQLDQFLLGEVVVRDYYDYFGKENRDMQERVHSRLQSNSQSYPFAYRKSKENPSDAITTLETLINDALYFISSTFKNNSEKEAFINHFRNLHVSTEAYTKLMKMKIYTLLGYLPLIKHNYFKGEEEWRLVILSDMEKDDEVEIQVVNNIFYRFKTIKLTDFLGENIELTTGPLLALKPKSFIQIQNKNISYLIKKKIPSIREVTIGPSIVDLRK